MTSRYQAPFAPGGSAPIDRALAERLLAVALEQGGDYADLFFEYAVNGSYGYDEGLLKSAGRYVTMGLGVRVMQGDATGYAYVESLDWDALTHAARTASQIARGGKSVAPVALTSQTLPVRYPVVQHSLDVEGVAKRALLERADRAARALDERIVKVTASLNEELREILVATSAGHFAWDSQPLVRFGVNVIAEAGGKRQTGSSGGGGRTGMEYLEAHTPEAHAAEAVRQALAMLDAREAPAGEMEVVLAPGDSGILLHEAVGHGLEADFNRKKT
jgi:TldD protein